MNFKDYPLGVHISENSVKMITGVVQYDDGNLFSLQLYEGTKAFDFSGYTVINASILRPDGTKITDSWAYDAEDGTTLNESHTYLAMQYVDPENGRITLQVGGSATELVGLHRMALEIYSEDAKLTTARINYNVVETLDNIDVSLLQNNEDYVSLQSLLAKCSDIIDKERERVNQEAARIINDAERETRLQEIHDEYMEKMSEMEDSIREVNELFNASLQTAVDAAETAMKWAQLAKAVSVQDLPAAIATMDDLSDLQTALETQIAAADARTRKVELTGEGDRLYLPSVAKSSLTSWFANNAGEGALVYCPDDQALYAGDGEGGYTAVKDPDRYSAYVLSATAPVDTRSLWIDTASGIMKYYDGSSWVATGTVAMFG